MTTARLMFAEASVFLRMCIFVDVYVFFFSPVARSVVFFSYNYLFTVINFTSGCFLTFDHHFPPLALDAASHALHFPEQAYSTWSETGGPPSM